MTLRTSLPLRSQTEHVAVPSTGDAGTITARRRMTFRVKSRTAVRGRSSSLGGSYLTLPSDRPLR